MKKQLEHFYDNFFKMNNKEKLIFLCNLSYIISMMARSTYEAGTLKVMQPDVLRRYNELLHRISTQQKDLAEENEQCMPEKIFFQMVSEEITNLGISDAVLKLLTHNVR